jgi:predicted site-specific integrase-resolvase
MQVVIHPTTGQKLVCTAEACKIYGCGRSNITMLVKAGELKPYVESPRKVYFVLDEVKRLAKQKAATRKKRGGRPRSGAAA